MPRPPYVLVIDQGGHSTRAQVFDSDLSVIAKARIPITTSRHQERFVEHEAKEVLLSLLHVIGDISNQLDGDVAFIQTAGLACQRSSIVCWDKQSGDALTAVISWQDTRGYQYLGDVRPAEDEISCLTGLRLSPHYGASKMRWCLDNVPGVQSAYKENQLVAGPMATWLVVQLTHNPQASADVVNAARTSLVNVSDRQWDKRLCELFGVPMSVLPPLVDNNASFGDIDLAGHAVPLMYVNGDQSAALFASGEPDTQVLYLNIGSGAFMQRATQGSVKSVAGLLNGLVESDGFKQWYSVEATINGAANALDWLSIQEGIDVGCQLDEWLLPATDALFINAVGGLASPWWKEKLQSRFINDSDIRSRVTAVIESIVFLATVNMEAMADVFEAPEKIVVSGGLSQLDGLCARLADLSQTRVLRIRSGEGTAMGVARRLLPEAVSEMDVDEIVPQVNTALRGRYEMWLEEMKRLIE